MKQRNPMAHARSKGQLRTRVVQDKRRKTGRKAKHKRKENA